MWLKARIICALGVILLLTGLTAIAPATSSAAPQDKDKSDKPKRIRTKKTNLTRRTNPPKARPRRLCTGNAVLWREPTDIESRDLFHGAGGAEGAPNPSGKFTFVKRDTGGTSEKIIVKDEKGREWSVKFGAEARPETAASRIIWAAGYHVDQNYFVKEAHIEGRGGFDVWDVRFERKDDGFKTLAPGRGCQTRLAASASYKG